MDKQKAPTLKEKYFAEVVDTLKKELSLGNIFEVPKLEKVVINIGTGNGSGNAKLMDAALAEIATITGQKPLVTRAKKSIAGFKVREGMPIGAKVTLRGDRMYEFMTKMVGVVLPRIRDFKGLDPNGFDGRGNYNLGLKDQLVFPEINYDKVQQLRGMNITIVTSARNDMAARALMTQLGFPFRKTAKQAAEAAMAS
ncbi:MAG: 50S ribosomal protein L5 [Candidatus Melainabacteria bacterium]